MVIVGNPPYLGESANKGVWINNLLRGRDGDDPTGSYFEVDGRPMGERNSKWLNDDYVKFIRFAQWRIERTGEGILGFVTNHGYLYNPTFRGMRQSLMNAFDDIYLLDLHGNVKKQETAPDGGPDENVFDIQQGVAIALFVKRRDAHRKPAQVFHADLWGLRNTPPPPGGKYGWLSENDITTTEWTELKPRAPLYLFVQRDDSKSEEYHQGWPLNEVFPVRSVGIITARDKLAVQWSAADMRRVAADFVAREPDDARRAYGLRPDVTDWKVPWAQRDLRRHPDRDSHVRRFLYRPFDYRYTYYTGESRGFLCRPRADVMRHMFRGPNLALCVGRAGQVVSSYMWDVVTASKYPTDFNLFRRGGNCLCPLYTYALHGDDDLFSHSGETPVRQPNLDTKFVHAVEESLGIN